MSGAGDNCQSKLATQTPQPLRLRPSIRCSPGVGKAGILCHRLSKPWRYVAPFQTGEIGVDLYLCPPLHELEDNAFVLLDGKAALRKLAQDHFLTITMCAQQSSQLAGAAEEGHAFPAHQS